MAKQAFLDFIELFRESKVLWKADNRDYLNKNKKRLALEALLIKLKKIEANDSLTIDDVKK